MRTREPRTNVFLDARMRMGSSWLSASIRNVSKRGAMVALPSPPPAGTYVELRRGGMIIIAQVVWSDHQRCGLRSQRDISLSHLCETNPHQERYDGPDVVERRKKPRSDAAQTFARAGYLARALEYTAAAVFAIVLATVVGKMAFDVLAHPATAVTHAMDRCFATHSCAS
jgi:hypothetical protein